MLLILQASFRTSKGKSRKKKYKLSVFCFPLWNLGLCSLCLFLRLFKAMLSGFTFGFCCKVYNPFFSMFGTMPHSLYAVFFSKSFFCKSVAKLLTRRSWQWQQFLLQVDNNNPLSLSFHHCCKSVLMLIYKAIGWQPNSQLKECTQQAKDTAANRDVVASNFQLASDVTGRIF